MTTADLTTRQLAVAALIAKGLNDKEIAATLVPAIRPSTVRVHVVALAFRLNLPPNRNTRVMITRWWMRTFPVSLEAA